MAKHIHYQYSAGTHPDCHAPDSRFEFPQGQCLYFQDWRIVARDLAEDFHNEHDGRESSWPMEFRVYKDSECMWKGQVEREMEPCFYVCY